MPLSIPSPFSPSPDELSILLVEDYPADAKLTTLLLQEDPSRFLARPEICRTLSEALIAIQGAVMPHDVILLDLSLPDSEGMKTFRAIQKAAPRVPIIVLSNLDDDQLAAQLIAQGAQDCLQKDHLDSALLRRAIRYAIERKQSSERQEQLNADLERKNQELRDVHLLLIQAEKLESIGRLAAGIAHEVKNPLAVLQFGVDYLAESPPATPDPNYASVIERMHNAITRADAIIRGLVDFSSERQLDLREEDLNLAVANVLMFIKHELTKKSINVCAQCDPNLPKALMDRAKMEQVLINIFMNSIQAMEEGGQLTFTTYPGVFKCRDSGARRMEDLRNGDRAVVLRIDDEGCGIPPDKLDLIFDPFYTSKDTGQGTGLGLSVAKRIVDLHQGMIRLENRKGGGVRTTLALRAASMA